MKNQNWHNAHKQIYESMNHNVIHQTDVAIFILRGTKPKRATRVSLNISTCNSKGCTGFDFHGNNLKSSAVNKCLTIFCWIHVDVSDYLLTNYVVLSIFSSFSDIEHNFV